MLGGGLFISRFAGGNTTPPPAALPMPGAPAVLPTFPLSTGSRGPEVKKLQEALVRLGWKTAEIIHDAGGADGIFGKGTASAVQAAGYTLPVTQYIYNRIITGTPPDAQIPATTPPPATTDTGKHLFVSSWSGATVYQRPGGGKNIRVSDDTYLGKWTGKKESYWYQFETGITQQDGKELGRYTAWVSENQVKMVSSNELDTYMKGPGEEKSSTVVAWFISNGIPL